CKASLTSFDSQGDPAIAPGLAQKAVTDKKLVGIVGPAFSGESKAADPIFDKAGLNIITASATNPALSENGWKTFHRILGNDATQGPAAAKYIKDVLKAQKVFVSDDTSEYGKGLADIVKNDLGSAVAGSDETAADGKQDDFSPTVTKAKASGATVFFYGGYYSNASKLVKQLKSGGFTGTFVAADGVKDDGFIKGAGAAAEGAILTCPCLPPDKAADFAAAYKKAYNSDPATYSAEAYDAANVFHAGDGNLHPLVLFDDSVEGESDRAEEVSGAILDLCLQHGGSITGEHGVGSDKAKYMPRMFTEDDLDT
ncbi:hypothetical protein BJM39_31505, partial [Salmonella enterica subsp. enterica serovar Javiana]